jgi:hypothetical protein
VADYFEQTVIQQAIPETDMTPLFNPERDGQAWCFFAKDNPCTVVRATRDELIDVLASSPDRGSTTHGYVTERLAAAGADAAEIDLDLAATSWEFFPQDVVKRSQTPAYISVVGTFTCSRMRADGFGGTAMLITADVIRGKSTNGLIEEFLSGADLDDDAADPARRGAP